MTSDQRKSNDRRPAAGARTTAKSQTASKPRTSNSTTGRQSTAHRRSVSNEGKSGTTRGKSEGRGKKLNNGSGKKDSTQYELQNEITLMITLVVSILLLLSDFKLGGAVGNAVNGVMFGLFGVLAYLFPILLFLGVAFFLANRGNRNLPFKLFYIAGMFLMLLSLAQLMTNYLPAQWEATTENPYIRPSQYYSLSKQYRKGGGVLGGFICFLFEPLFGKAGSYVTVIALFLVFFMLFSRKAIFQWIAKAGKNRYALHKVHAMERREIFEEKQAERERLIEEKQKELSERRAKTYLLSEEEKFKANPEGKEERRKKNTVSSKSPRPDFEKMEIDPLTGEYVYAKQETFSTGKEKLWIDEKPVTEEVQKPEERSFFMGNRKKENESRNSFGFLSGEKSFPGNGAEPKTEPLRREPTVAEQLMKLGGPSDRATSGGQALWESTIPEAQKNETEIKPVSFREEQKIPEPVFEAGMDGNGVEKPIEPTVSRSTERKSSSQNAPVKKNSDDVTIPELPVNGEPEPSVKKYVYPPIDLLSKPKGMKVVSEHDLHETAMKLQTTLDSFGVHVTVTNVSCGPAVTRYELLPEQGVKVSKITSLADDIKLNLAAADVRIEAPIPGKAAVGIEVPNKENSMVLLRELLESKEFQAHPSKVAFAVGKDIGGQTVVTDIAKMPHLLIAGATGSGKSVCINTLIMSIIYKADPAEVKMIMVDPKVVELSVYNGIPHLMIPVVTDPKKASAALNWAVMEMTDRYQKFAELSVRDIKGYNERVENAKKEGLEEEKYKHLPQIIIIVDELADLMMVAPGEVEDSICRLAQLARAAGLHLVIATQRPSVNVITGLIKANIPSRIAFAVSSAIDSRTILDGSGAEKLLGKGDMLFFPSGYSKPIRVQGAFVSDHEVSAVVDFLKEQNEGAVYSSEVSEKITSAAVKSEDSAGGNASDGNDEFFGDAGKLIIEKDKASIGMLQRAYKIGFNRAARIMDQLCEAGVVGPEEGTKPRKVLMTEEEFNAYLGNGV